MAEEMLAGAMGAALFGALIIPFLILIAGIYVYSALAYQSIFRKSGYKRPWFAWIPILNVVPILQLGGFHWAWVFLVLASGIPTIGFIASIALAALIVVGHWRIFEKAGYKGALSLLVLVPIANYIIIGIVAWQKKTYKKTSVAKTKKKTTSKKKK